MIKELKKDFRNPPAWFRGAPFWSWNDDLKEKDIRRQIKDFDKAGIGGFFMHSRGGLETPFLSEEWFRICDAAVDEAGKRGMHAWAYDEDRWPSVHAGGLVVERFPEASGIVLESARKNAFPEMDSAVVGVFKRSGKSWKKVEKDAGEGDYLVFFEHAYKPSGWYNGRWPMDMVSKEAVAKFIEIAYEPYAERYKTEAGEKKPMPGVFTDEPSFFPGGQGHSLGGTVIAWGKPVRDEFRRRRGYDLAGELPALVGEKVSGGRKQRDVLHDYWLTMTELFSENFSRQIGDYCEKTGMLLTGHYLAEESLYSQTVVGGSVMPQYAWMQVPGIDILCRRTSELLTCKQTSSVCHQWDRDRLLSELYGASGWDLSLQDQKVIGDWQYALGVNYRCQHLCLYSLRGERKRDYPPSHMPHQPWFEHYHLIEDYFGRMSLALSSGKPVREVAVIHPIRSAWERIHQPSRREMCAEVDSSLYDLCDTLLYSQIDFDFIDEMLFEQFGNLRKSSLKMNKASYKIVVVPKMSVMSPSVARALIGGHKQGLQVIHAGTGRVRVYDSNTSARTLESLTKRLNTVLRENRVRVDSLPSYLRNIMKEPVEVHPQKRVLHMLRKDGKERLLFLTNQEEKPVDLAVTVKGGRDLTFWDGETGKSVQYPCEDEKGGTTFQIHLEQAGSALLSYKSGRPSTGTPPGESARPASKPRGVKLPKQARFSLDAPNVLYLDKAKIEIPDDGLALKGFLPQEARRVRGLYGYPSTQYRETQPWKWPHVPPTGKKILVTYSFDVQNVPKSTVMLGVEVPERKEIRLNGRKINRKPKGFYLDPSIPTITLPRLKKGKNEITVIEDLDIGFEAEALYLLGSFGVRNYKVCSLPKTLSPADWTKQGLPFYAGGVTFEVPVTLTETGTYEIELSHQGICTAGIRVGKGGEQVRAFAPWRYSIKLKKGRNALSVTLKNNLRNLMGPHHSADPFALWAGPSDLAPQNPVDRYVHIPSGLTGMRMAVANRG